ncbi:SRPBCC domain-containing protein [Maritimibacter sp. UBA3975]|uniref:SRPBCC domain-containing protein n=1 Tax=Maritimibacter sp. UBA3975 TaxID=1946833 RepID=UPI0025BC3E45|nr:SRPBCC domain-containing protein [Maritimibacter sp. UBA3975]|tara:strand:- start:1635 stop:2096 length:462 start_codon:yes stop_codon:yes gene_type:complete
MIPGPTQDVRTTRYLKSTPGALYRGLTDGRLLVEWFKLFGEDLAGATVEPQPGGAFDLTRAQAGASLETYPACVIEARSGARIVITTALGAGYRPTGVHNPATLILDLHEIASGTRLEASLIQTDGARPGPLASWDDGVARLDSLAADMTQNS